MTLRRDRFGGEREHVAQPRLPSRETSPEPLLWRISQLLRRNRGKGWSLFPSPGWFFDVSLEPGSARSNRLGASAGTKPALGTAGWKGGSLMLSCGRYAQPSLKRTLCLLSLEPGLPSFAARCITSGHDSPTTKHRDPTVPIERNSLREVQVNLAVPRWIFYGQEPARNVSAPRRAIPSRRR